MAVVRPLLDLCVQGYGYHYIAAFFKKEGILSPAGVRWNTSRVGKLIRPAGRRAVRQDGAGP